MALSTFSQSRPDSKFFVAAPECDFNLISRFVRFHDPMKVLRVLELLSINFHKDVTSDNDNGIPDLNSPGTGPDAGTMRRSASKNACDHCTPVDGEIQDTGYLG